MPNLLAYVPPLQLEGDSQNFRMLNGRFKTTSGHFFANYMNIFHKTLIITCSNLVSQIVSKPDGKIVEGTSLGLSRCAVWASTKDREA